MFCANSSHGIANSRDKLRSLQVLSRHHIGIPETTFVRDKKDVLPAIERVGGAPVVIKLLEGTQGVGVILADSNKVAEAIIETLQSAKQNVLIQKFVAESKGRDVRAFVVGDQVVAAMRRVAQGQEFRSNVHRGGKTEVIDRDVSESGLRDRDINVLTLHRGTTVVPNPNSMRALEPGDRLLCFGRLESMRSMVPEKTRKKRRPRVMDLELKEDTPGIVPDSIDE